MYCSIYNTSCPVALSQLLVIMGYKVNAIIGVFLLSPFASALRAKNFIYIVPDGYGQASQTMARDFVSLQGGNSTASAPIIAPLAADQMVCNHFLAHIRNC